MILAVKFGLEHINWYTFYTMKNSGKFRLVPQPRTVCCCWSSSRRRSSRPTRSNSGWPAPGTCSRRRLSLPRAWWGRPALSWLRLRWALGRLEVCDVFSIFRFVRKSTYAVEFYLWDLKSESKMVRLALFLFVFNCLGGVWTRFPVPTLKLDKVLLNANPALGFCWCDGLNRGDWGCDGASILMA